jgi:hypothetical protein
MAGESARITVGEHTVIQMAAREFTLKALQKALSAASIRTAENLSAHGQPIYTLDGKVVRATAAAGGAKARKTRVKR